jgi:hydrogenase expression/formation protein HypE
VNRSIAGAITLAHGAGGRASHQLIRDIFLFHLGNPFLQQGDDGAVLDPLEPNAQGRWVTATDAHVVTPLEFPGGDIGRLAVNGTINDLAMMGATPRYLTAAFILEEGLSLALLDRIVASMATASREAGVPVVAGDTKVVERGKGDGIFITTSGFGLISPGIQCGGRHAKPGDAILVSGTLGDHAIALMAERNGLIFDSPLLSDTAALHGLVANILRPRPEAVHVLRDPTRGGVATVLNEIAQQSGVAIEIDESQLPMRPEVSAAAELLGLDPLYLANEGKVIVICDATDAEAILLRMREHPLGQRSARIGEVLTSSRPYVEMKTRWGGRRLVDWLMGELLPRIC